MSPEAPSASSPPPAAWRAAVRGNVLAMGLVSLFTDFSSEMMNPLLPVFITGLVAAQGGEPAAAFATAALSVGLMEGLAETIAALLKLFSGRFSDYLGRRKILVLFGYGISSLVRPLTGLAGSVFQVIALKSADRIGKGLRTSPRDALIGDSVNPEVRGLAFSFHRAMDHVGAVLGPLAAIALLYLLIGKVLWEGGQAAPGEAEMRALRWLFAFALVPGLGAMAVLFFMVKEIAPVPLTIKTAAHLPGGAGESAWRQLPRQFYGFIGMVTLFALGNSTDMFLILLAKARFSMGLLSLIGMWIALHLAKILFSLPGGILSDRLGRKPVIVAGWLLYAFCYLGFALVQNAWQFWLLLLFYGAYYGLTEGAEKALVTDYVPARFRGTAFGIYHSAEGLALLPASLLFGLVWQRFGAGAAFGIGAGCAGLAALLLLLLPAPRRPAADPPV